MRIGQKFYPKGVLHLLFRTDLALERAQMLGKKEIPGISQRTYEIASATVSEIKVTDADGEKTIGKPQGTYITVEVPAFTVSRELTDGRLDALVTVLRSLLPEQGAVLVAGLGNTAITADALGPKCAQMIFATRHIAESLQEKIGIGKLRPVAVLSPGVLGCTGIEAQEIITAVTQKIKPSAVISVDALAAKSIKRLANTVQLSDTGISPGSGVGNHRNEISFHTIGVPVIAMGVPTVVDAGSIAQDLTGADENSLPQTYKNVFVSPREIDTVTDSAAKLLSLAINCALQKNLTAQELLSLV